MTHEAAERLRRKLTNDDVEAVLQNASISLAMLNDKISGSTSFTPLEDGRIIRCRITVHTKDELANRGIELTKEAT